MRLFLLLFLLLPGLLPAQFADKEDIPATQTGVKFTWGLEFPNKNTFQGRDYFYLLSGNRLGIQAYQNIPLSMLTQFSPGLGVTYIRFEKSQTYNRDCAQDSFPTFWSFSDSLPGRDIKILAVTIEPAFKFYVVPWNLYLRFSPVAHIQFSTRFENYGHSCGVSAQRSFMDWEESVERKKSAVMVGFSLGMVKEIRLSPARWLALETGMQTMINPILETNSPNFGGPRFDLGFTGFYVNFGFFRKWLPREEME